jgi:hypothetical protein
MGAYDQADDDAFGDGCARGIERFYRRYRRRLLTSRREER